MDVVARVRAELDEGSAVNASNQLRRTLGAGLAGHLQGLKSILPTWQSVVKTIVRATALAAAFFGMRAMGRVMSSSVKEFASFDKKLTDSISLLGKFGLQVKAQLGDAAKKVAKDLNIEFDEVAESIGHLISAGYDAAQSQKVLGTVANFSKASSTSMRESVDYLSDSLYALGLYVKDDTQLMINMTRVSDVMSKANNISNATIRDFAEALTNKSAAAMRMFNIEVEEGIAVLAAYASQGKKGAEAGTYFDMFLRDVTRAAIKNEDAFKAMNIRVFELDGSMRPLASIIDDFSGALGSLQPKQQTMAMLQLGMTQRSLHATKILLGLGDAVREYEAEAKNANGTTKEMTDVRMTSFSERIGKVMMKFKEAKLELGEEFIPILEDAANALTDPEHGMNSALKDMGKYLQDNKKDIGEMLKMVIEMTAFIAKLSLLLSKPFIWVWKIVIQSPIDAMNDLNKQFEGLERKNFNGQTLQEYIANRGKKQGSNEALSMSNDFAVGKSDIDYTFPDNWLDEPNAKKAAAGLDDDLDFPDSEAEVNRKTAAMNALAEELAKLTGSKSDDRIADIKKLEDRFKKAYGKNIPAAAKEGISKLREAAMMMADFDKRSKQLTLFKDMPETGTTFGALYEYINILKMERDKTEEGSKAREEYNKLIEESEQLYMQLSETIKDHAITAQDLFEKRMDTGKIVLFDMVFNFEMLADAGANAAYDIMGAFTNMFDMLWDDAARTQSLFETVAGGIAGALLNGVAQYAGTKAAENVALGFENIAKSQAAYAAAIATFNPAMAVAGAGYAAAAKTNFVSAAKWGALGAVAASAAGAVGSSGRGGTPNRASDVGGAISEENREKLEVHIYVDGVDPKNPRHQRLIGQTADEYKSRGATVTYHSGKK